MCAEKTGEIVTYVWGKRDIAIVQRLKEKLKQLGIHYTRISSNQWDSFITTFKDCQQSIGKFFTIGIEGNNCKIRHRIRCVSSVLSVALARIRILMLLAIF
jgi:insertion element IS1 protein InsB